MLSPTQTVSKAPEASPRRAISSRSPTFKAPIMTARFANVNPKEGKVPPQLQKLAGRFEPQPPGEKVYITAYCCSKLLHNP